MNSGNPFNLVILDLTIPAGMGGKATLIELKKIDPKVKAIVSSGYSVDPVMSEFENHGFLGIIAKPYKIEDFSRVIFSVISKNENNRLLFYRDLVTIKCVTNKCRSQ